MRSKPTLLPIAIGCIFWYAVNREAIAAGPDGEAVAFDLWFPFLIPFGLTFLVRDIYRWAKRKARSDKEPKAVNRTATAHEDPEVARLRRRLREAEKQAANKAALPKLRERKMLAENRVRELTRELEEAEASIAQLDE
jgi:hypothetical protein